LVKISEIPDDANIITSHVIYRYKTDGSLKARIVPHGHLDDEKSFLRTDAPTISVKVLRLFLSIAKENDWRVGSQDIKAAYLQANGFSREIYVGPPQEEADILHPWKLENPAYGLSDSGRLWFLASFSVLQARDLQPCPYEKQCSNQGLPICLSPRKSIISYSQAKRKLWRNFLHIWGAVLNFRN
jgi:hypothetical protein